MIIAILAELHPGERRVAATPDSVRRLKELGFDVVVQAGAGAQASHTDEAYQRAGATVEKDAAAVWAAGDVVLKVRAPMPDPMGGKHEAECIKEGATLLSFISPAQNAPLLEMLAKRNVTTFGVDQVPRISRAQSMDALSSMANIAGYRAVVEAAQKFGSFFTGQMTAAGKVPPAKVLVIGAGVAGLAAVAAARGLGAVVRAFDTRPAVKDQVGSLGAEFLEVHIQESGDGAGGYAKEMSPAFIAAEMALFAAQAKEVDIIITTALIPGKPAPRLITAAMVESMKPGSVIVDMAAEQGGNCELTRPGEACVEHGVHILGFTDLPSRLATTASQLYGNNLIKLLELMKSGPGTLKVDLGDEIVRGALVTHAGAVTWPPPPKPKEAPAAAPVAAKPVASALATHGKQATPVSPSRSPARRSRIYEALALVALALWTYAMRTQQGAAAPEMMALVNHATVFVLACFVGWQVIWNVNAALHTPLMSVTNAISGIILVGGMLQSHGSLMDPSVILATLAILLATINISGGFLVTHRMLKMFRK